MPIRRCSQYRRSSFYLLRRSCLPLATVASCVLLAAGAAPPAAGESTVLLPYPPEDVFGVVPSSTYDQQGQRVGDGAFLVERLPDERVAVRFHGGFDDGARIELDSILDPVEVDGRRMLRVSSERSQSHDPEGNPLVILEIDHAAGKARCIPPEGQSGRASEMDLPEPDRVVNVPLNLLFRPIGLGETRSVASQAFLCLGGARVMGFTGEIAQDDTDVAGRTVRKIRYSPDGKSFLSWAVQPFAPEVAYWIDVADGAAYLAHRMPLYSRGPVVTFVVDGMKPDVFLDR